MNNFKIFLLIMSISFLNAEQSCKSHPEWSRNASIYEANIRQHSEVGTFAEFEKYLPEIKDMGFDIVWLMPIHPIGEKNRKGSLGSYYSVQDYKKVNPEFGTLDDFRNLVKVAHSHGMKVIIDWVANHSAWDHPWIIEHPDWYHLDGNGSMHPPVDDWTDVADLEYNNPELREAMIQALEFWVREADIDGYRCDVAAMVPTKFWEQATSRLNAIKPVFMLAEAHEGELHEAFDMTYNWQLKDLLNNIAAGKTNIAELKDWWTYEQKHYHKDAYRMNFVTNHDENSWSGTVEDRLGQFADVATALTFILPGMPLAYSGQEAGDTKMLEFFEKDAIDWKAHHWRQFFKKLNSLKKRNQALWNGIAGGDFNIISREGDEEILIVHRRRGSDEILAFFSFTEREYIVKMPSQFRDTQWINVFENTGILKGLNLLTLPPHSFVILEAKF